MLLIGCSKIDVVIDMLDGKEIDGCKFELVSKKGIQATFRHSLDDDMAAKRIVKGAFAAKPEYKALFLSVQPTK